MSKKECPDCGPLPTDHFSSWMNDLMNMVTLRLNLVFRKRNGRESRLGKFLSSAALKILEAGRVISFVTDIDRSKIYNRTLIVFDEAKKRGIKTGAVLIFGRYNNQFFADIDGRRTYFEGLPMGRESTKKENFFIDDKARVKKILAQNGFPVAEGKSFFAKWRGRRYAKKLGWPIAVKPRWGSISRHIFLNINDEKNLRRAIRSVKKICPFYIIERFVDNALVHRATLVDFKVGGVARRVPANVTGDGIKTVKELVEIKNSYPWRGEPKQKDATYLKIVLDQTTDKLLMEKNLTLESVLPAGEKIFLQEKIILDLGADLIDITDDCHPDNIKMFEEIARIFDAKILGIDFLAPDISKSWKEQRCAILELNSLPFIDMHHFPLEGQPRNLAAMVWDMVLQEHKH